MKMFLAPNTYSDHRLFFFNVVYGSSEIKLSLLRSAHQMGMALFVSFLETDSQCFVCAFIIWENKMRFAFHIIIIIIVQGWLKTFS